MRRGPLRLSELAELEGLNPTMLSRVIARARRRRGWSSASRDPGDRRAALVEATPAGGALRERIRRERTDVLSVALDELSEQRAQPALEDALPALERARRAACKGERA